MSNPFSLVALDAATKQATMVGQMANVAKVTVAIRNMTSNLYVIIVTNQVTLPENVDNEGITKVTKKVSLTCQTKDSRETGARGRS